MKASTKEQAQSLAQDSDYLTLKEGEHILRVSGDLEFALQHRYKTPAGYRYIVCPIETRRKEISMGQSDNYEIPPCPVCEEGKKDDSRTRFSFLAYVVKRSNERAYVLRAGKQLYDKLVGFQFDENWGNLEEYDIKVIVTGKELKTKYDAQAVPKEKSKPLNERELFNLDEIKSKIDIKDSLVPKSYEEIKAIMVEEKKGEADIPF